MSKQKIKLGNYVEDTITGYDGVCVGIINYLNGCARIGIQHREKRHSETGLPVETYWVDETTVKVKKEPKNTKQQKVESIQKETGGLSTSSGRNDVPKF